jgi:GntR family transcriptional regulator
MIIKLQGGRRRKVRLSAGDDDPTPLYYRLQTILRNSIESGEYPAGGRLPPERELSEHYGVSRITVRHAVDMLVREGMLQRQRGRRGGTFVLQIPPKRRLASNVAILDRMATAVETARIEVLAFDIRKCDSRAAQVLGLRNDTKVRYVERLIWAPDGPVAYLRNYVPLPLGNKLQPTDLKERFIKDLLPESLGVRIASASDEVEAYLADSRVAELLRIGSGSPILRVTRVYLTRGQQPLFASVALVNTRYLVSVAVSDLRSNLPIKIGRVRASPRA